MSRPSLNYQWTCKIIVCSSMELMTVKTDNCISDLPKNSKEIDSKVIEMTVRMPQGISSHLKQWRNSFNRSGTTTIQRHNSTRALRNSISTILKFTKLIHTKVDLQIAQCACRVCALQSCVCEQGKNLTRYAPIARYWNWPVGSVVGGCKSIH